MIKKTFILAAIIALTTNTVMAAETTSTTQDKKPPKCESCHKMPPRDMHRKGEPMDFEKRLNLTDKQKEQIKKNREADRKKMEPIMTQLREKEQAKMEIIKKYEQSDAQLIKLNKEIKALRDKRHQVMEENRKSFESILTTEQKAELEKIKAEHMERFNNGKDFPKFSKTPERRPF